MLGEPLSIAVRAWTHHQNPASTKGKFHGEGKETSRRPRWRGYPSEALVFDTETERGPSQRIRFLVWRFYRDRKGSQPGVFCVEEGIAYPDEMPERDPTGFAELIRYTASHEWAASRG